MTQTARTVRKRNFLRIVDYLRISGGLGAALHGRQERHDLILFHNHRAHSIDDFKVFQLCLLVIQLLELTFEMCIRDSFNSLVSLPDDQPAMYPKE